MLGKSNMQHDVRKEILMVIGNLVSYCPNELAAEVQKLITDTVFSIVNDQIIRFAESAF